MFFFLFFSFLSLLPSSPSHTSLASQCLAFVTSACVHVCMPYAGVYQYVIGSAKKCLMTKMNIPQ